MIGRRFRSLVHSDGGNVAPIVALSLFALLGAGGIAFDYARLASLDTELQNAADQAALAAASQLDGALGACARAAAAASNVQGATDNLLTNDTRFANEPASTPTAIRVNNEGACDATGVIQFYQSYDQDTDTFGPAATSDANAKVVFVQVNPREAFYTLTPVVGAFSSGPIRAEAVAALGSAMCRVPPLMMCNPSEPEGNTNPDFDFNPPEGAGLRLVIDRPDAPGNFGFLRIDDAGAREVAVQIGYDNPPTGCINTTGVDTQPGDMQAVRAALNTRFDISENGNMTCPGGGVCSSSINARKDLVRAPADECNLSGSGWREVQSPLQPYRATNATPLSDSNPMIADNPDTADVDEKKIYPDAMGYPRDLCHVMSVSGQCAAVTGNSIVGDGIWDIDAYFAVNYPSWAWRQWMNEVDDENGVLLAATAADIPTVSRYDVYKWEIRTYPTAAPRPIGTSGVNSYAAPVCRGSVTPTPTVADRRRVSVAVINCEAEDLRGQRDNVRVIKWLDVFLLEPSVARGNGPNQRTTNGDVYVEVIDVATSGVNTDNFAMRRDVPYLIR